MQDEDFFHSRARACALAHAHARISSLETYPLQVNFFGHGQGKRQKNLSPPPAAKYLSHHSTPHSAAGLWPFAACGATHCNGCRHCSSIKKTVCVIYGGSHCSG